MNIYRFLACSALLMLPLGPAVAATFLTPEGESASVRSEISGDLYAASNAVVVAAPVRGDIFAAGDSVDISGTSDASIFAAGRSVTISGDVKDDIRVAGTSISLTSSVAHDAFAVGSSVHIGPEAFVGGDIYTAGSDITIAGTIQGNVNVAGDRVRIAKGASIMGNVTSYGTPAVIEDGAIIKGTTKTVAEDMKNRTPTRRDTAASLIRSAASRALLAVILLWLAPLIVPGIRTKADTAPLYSGLVGLVIVLLFVPVTLLLAVMGIGIHVAGLVLAATLFLIILGIGTSTLLLGGWLMRLFTTTQTPLTWQHAVIGATGAALLSFLGPLGMLALFIIFLVGVGAIALTVKPTIYG